MTEVNSRASNASDGLPSRDREPDPQRRILLKGLTASYLCSIIPPAAAQPTVGPQDAFVEVSKLLTGRSALDPEQSARLYGALTTALPGFAAAVQSLQRWMSDRQINLGQLQQLLDAEGLPFSGLPRTILTAWYTGVVGDHCITFETSLMHVVVADRLNPPSYCAGPYGSWAREPGEEG